MSGLSMPTVSVVICCYSDVRFDDLRASLASVLWQVGLDDTVVVVVDHNEQLKARVETAFPAVRVVANDGPRGLSSARNTGIRSSTGSLVIFLDDDAEAAADMVATMKEVVADDEDIVGVAGRVEPYWIGGRPSWFPAEFLWVVGCTYKGLEPGTVRNMIGAAMAVRRAAFENVGGFVDGIGRRDSRLPLGCEETEFCIRATERMPGTRFVYVANASCHHKVPAARATLRYLATRCYAEGLSKAGLSAHAVTVGKLATERRYVINILPHGVMRGCLDGILRRDPSGFIRAFAILLGLACTIGGYCVGRAVQMFQTPPEGAFARLIPPPVTRKIT